MKLVSERDAEGLSEFPFAAAIAMAIPDGVGVTVVGCDWASTHLRVSGTRGLMVRAGKLSGPIPGEWMRPDFQYLALC